MGHGDGLRRARHQTQPQSRAQSIKAELGVVLGLERFLKEIEVTANLHHPNLLPMRKAAPSADAVQWNDGDGGLSVAAAPSVGCRVAGITVQESAAVPVTARLSKKLHDRLGDDVTDELVDWFNQVDATARSDLRELIELNFARFDAKLEQRMAELRSELRTEMHAAISASRDSLLRWMIGLWVTQMLAFVGLWMQRR
jgi:hypothetical protein